MLPWPEFVLSAVLPCCLEGKAEEILGLSIKVPGADLGVAGAALGTILAELVSTCLLLWFLVVKSDKIALVGHRL